MERVRPEAQQDSLLIAEATLVQILSLTFAVINILALPVLSLAPTEWQSRLLPFIGAIDSAAFAYGVKGGSTIKRDKLREGTVYTPPGQLGRNLEDVEPLIRFSSHEEADLIESVGKEVLFSGLDADSIREFLAERRKKLASEKNLSSPIFEAPRASLTMTQFDEDFPPIESKNSAPNIPESKPFG